MGNDALLSEDEYIQMYRLCRWGYSITNQLGVAMIAFQFVKNNWTRVFVAMQDVPKLSCIG
jgi:hypothetical protein